MTGDSDAAQNLQWGVTMVNAFMTELDEEDTDLFENTVNHILEDAEGDVGRMVKGLANVAAAMATAVERTWGVPKHEFLAKIFDVGEKMKGDDQESE